MPDGGIVRRDMPMQERLAPLENVDVKARTANLVWSTGARVKRYDWMREQYYLEELSLDAAHVRMGRLQNGAPLLNAHLRWNLADQIGVVEFAALRAGEGTATVRFSSRDEVAPILRDVQEKIIRNVSVGYVVYKFERLPPDETSEGLPIMRAVDWEPSEISLVPIGADAGAGVRGQEQQRTYPCEIIDSSVLITTADPAITQERTMAEPQAVEKPAAVSVEAAQTKARNAAQAAERERVREIMARCDQHGLTVEFRNALIDEGVSLETAGARMLDELARRQQQSQGTIASVSFGEGARIDGGNQAKRRALMADAISHRIDPRQKLDGDARHYRGMSLLRMAEDVLSSEGVNVRGLSQMELATRGLMSTSDFANILADVANKRLRRPYDENVPSYARWARRAPNAPDFKNINAMQLSAMPGFEAVPEGAEFKYGSLSDGKETYAITTYGKVIAITRQAIINDDLRALDDLPRMFGMAARRLENATVYNILLSNPVMADGDALFHANHNNLPAGAAIGAASLGLARALMRKQIGLASEPLNIAPRFLLVGPDYEQLAYQYTSSQFVPSQASNINEFRAGGRTALEPIVEALVTGNKWFLAADSGQIDTVEYCYLDGNEGVYLEQQIGFEVDGIKLKGRLDFAAKAIDWRGLVYNAGA